MKTYIVDSFTDEPFKGNPAGVCLPTQPLPDHLMLAIAQELGLSETAFVRKADEGNHYHIRFFSPKLEIPLCGHATLAAAKVLFTLQKSTAIHFKNIQNLDLYVEQVGKEIALSFPVYTTTPATAPEPLLAALGLETVINVAYNAETNILLLEIESPAQLQQLTPDFSALYAATDSINGVLVTAPAQDGYDFHSRYFWPWSGTNEDPVTGGSHTFLAPYWSERLGKTKMQSFQSSQRTGFMEVELVGEDQLIIRSQAQIIFIGELVVSALGLKGK